MNVIFTFQYVSIISDEKEILFASPDSFTFQYVSIISGSDRTHFGKIFVDLHSNMFLLFLEISSG